MTNSIKTLSITIQNAALSLSAVSKTSLSIMTQNAMTKS